MLQDSETNAEELTSGFGELNHDTLINSLQQRQDLSAEEANNIVNRLEGVRDKILNQASELRQKVEDYLRNTNLDELNPEGIERDFKTLIDEPQAGVEALRKRLSQFDRQTLVQLLSQRQDLSEERVNEILDNLESVRDKRSLMPKAYRIPWSFCFSWCNCRSRVLVYWLIAVD